MKHLLLLPKYSFFHNIFQAVLCSLYAISQKKLRLEITIKDKSRKLLNNIYSFIPETHISIHTVMAKHRLNVNHSNKARV